MDCLSTNIFLVTVHGLSLRTCCGGRRREEDLRVREVPAPPLLGLETCLALLEFPVPFVAVPGPIVRETFQCLAEQHLLLFVVLLRGKKQCHWKGSTVMFHSLVHLPAPSLFLSAFHCKVWCFLLQSLVLSREKQNFLLFSLGSTHIQTYRRVYTHARTHIHTTYRSTTARWTRRPRSAIIVGSARVWNEGE